MNRRALTLLLVATVAACARSDDSTSLADTVPMPPVDGSIPLVSPGSVPALTIPARPPDDPGAIEDPDSVALGVDSVRARPSRIPRDAGGSRDTARSDSIIGRDSAVTGPIIPVPVPPDTG